jgi:hypothetical protein
MVMSWKRVLARRTSRQVKLSIQPAGTEAADVEDLVAVQVQVAVECSNWHLHGGDQYIEGLRVDRDGPDGIRFFLFLQRNLLAGQISSSRVRYEMSNFDRDKEIKPLR